MIATHIIQVTDGAQDMVLTAQFEVDVETYSAEPTSWGASRGNDVSCICELTAIHIGNWCGTRTDAIAMFGAEQIAEREADMAELTAYGAAA